MKDVDTKELTDLLDDSETEFDAGAYKEEDTSDTQEHKKPEHLQEKSDKQEQKKKETEKNEELITAAASQCEHFIILRIRYIILIYIQNNNY